jgi:hypothetical protein
MYRTVTNEPSNTSLENDAGIIGDFADLRKLKRTPGLFLLRGERVTVYRSRFDPAGTKALAKMYHFVLGARLDV